MKPSNSDTYKENVDIFNFSELDSRQVVTEKVPISEQSSVAFHLLYLPHSWKWTTVVQYVRYSKYITMFIINFCFVAIEIDHNLLHFN